MLPAAYAAREGKNCLRRLFLLTHGVHSVNELADRTGHNRNETADRRLHGACHSCPHAMMTLKNGIEAEMRERLSPDLTVERVMDA